MRPIKEAAQEAYVLICARNIVGAQFNALSLSKRIERAGKYGEDLFTMGWERGWGCGCTLKVNIREGENRGEKVWNLECEISWSSTGHGIASALCAITLYGEVVALAAMLETQWSHPPVAYEETK